MLALATPDAGAPAPSSSDAPDPEPTVSARELILDFAWEKGTPVLARASVHALAAPRKAGRWMGRFALELAEGPALLERVRFNVPLMHEPPPTRASYTNPPNFEQGLSTSMRIVFPQLEAGNRFELVDRATGRRWALPWPITGDLGRTPLKAVAKPATEAKPEAPAR
jgi:hypothetical protein